MDLDRTHLKALSHQFLQDCEELHEWIQEKNVLVQQDNYRSAKTLHSKHLKHQAFESEIASNKERLELIERSGNELLSQKPEMKDIIQPKLSQLLLPLLAQN